MMRGGKWAADPEDVAIRCLGFMASDPERLGRFLSITGLGPENLRDAAGSPGFLASVLDYVAGDETLLVEAADSLGLAPEAIAAAHRKLAGHPPALL
jgi:hypothetical protein